MLLRVLPRALALHKSMQVQQRCCSSAATSTLSSVQNYYGKVLQSSKDLKTSACTTSSAPSDLIQQALRKVPQEVKDKYYGCGSPLPTGIDGLRVLDLGSGSGRDCYIAAQLVGENGHVIGIDMTNEQLDVAKRHVDSFCKDTMQYNKANISFRKGFIEYLKDAGVEDESVDLVISNCVINLSPDKPKVIKGVYDALAVGGELHFSDVYCDRRLSDEVRANEVLWGECISGALYVEDFKRICADVGFTDVRELARDPIHITDPSLKSLVGNAQFYSITYRCFKLNDLETLCEDYGQVGVYKGTIRGHEHKYVLDNGHVFEKNRPMLVCGNTASMLEESWLKNHFQVTGDRSEHFGLFGGCYEQPEQAQSSGELGGFLNESSGGGCC